MYALCGCVAVLYQLIVIYLIYMVSYGCVVVMLVYWSEYLNEWGSRNYRYCGTTGGGIDMMVIHIKGNCKYRNLFSQTKICLLSFQRWSA